MNIIGKRLVMLMVLAILLESKVYGSTTGPSTSDLTTNDGFTSELLTSESTDSTTTDDTASSTDIDSSTSSDSTILDTASTTGSDSSTVETSTDSDSTTIDTVTDRATDSTVDSSTGSDPTTAPTNTDGSTDTDSTTIDSVTASTNTDGSTDTDSTTIDSATASTNTDGSTDTASTTIDSSTDTDPTTASTNTDGSTDTDSTTIDNATASTNTDGSTDTDSTTIDSATALTNTDGSYITDSTTIDSSTASTNTDGSTRSTSVDASGTSTDGSISTMESTDSSGSTTAIGSTDGSGSTDSVGSTDGVVTDTTTTTTTTPKPTTTPPYLASTKYPVKKPDIKNANFTFEFQISFSSPITDIGKILTDLESKYKESFKNLDSLGFIDVYVVQSIASRQKRQANEERFATAGAIFEAEKVINDNNLDNLQTEVENAVNQVNETFVEFDVETPNYDELLNWNNPCKVKNPETVCDKLDICDADSKMCIHRCERETCNGHGDCTVVYEDLDGVWTNAPRAVCVCTRGSGLYEYSGDSCMESSLKWEAILGFSVGVGGFIIAILVVTAIFLCCRGRSAEKEKFIDGYSEPDRDLYNLHDYHNASGRALLAPRNPVRYVGRTNEAYEGEHYDPYFYSAGQDRRPWLYVPDGPSTPKHGSQYDKGLMETDFAIRRPKLSTTPLEDQRL